MTFQPRCTDFGGANFANWDPALWTTCQTACSQADPNSYCSWLPAQCSGATFAGCTLAGRQTCSDWGNASLPNWNDAAWAACHTACSSPNPSAYCAWIPPKVVAGTFSGCNRVGQPTCSDWGNSSFPNWSDAAWATCQASCTSSCPGANPNDNLADDAALQACLNAGGSIRLVPGTVGYILASGLRIMQSGTTFTSAAAPGRARLVASSALASTMLIANGLSNTRISYLEFDGNRPARSGLVPTCSGFRINQTNVSIAGMTGGSFDHNRSTRAVCGTAFGFNGSDFEIANNLFDNNGHGREAADAAEPWSDGMTLGLCARTSVHDNWVTDATDVGIVDGGGQGCSLHDNVVVQLNRHAFAGIQLGNFSQEGMGDHRRSLLSGNSVRGGGLMSFGIGFGHHPWDPSLFTLGGTVSNNTVSGAVVDLMVDGVRSATVSQNTLSSPVGTPVCGFGPATYTAGHTSGSSLTPGFVATTYDGCIP